MTALTKCISRIHCIVMHIFSLYLDRNIFFQFQFVFRFCSGLAFLCTLFSIEIVQSVFRYLSQEQKKYTITMYLIVSKRRLSCFDFCLFFGSLEEGNYFVPIAVYAHCLSIEESKPNEKFNKIQEKNNYFVHLCIKCIDSK